MHESTQGSETLLDGFDAWLNGLPDYAFRTGERVPRPIVEHDLTPVYRAVWTRKLRYIQRANEREAGR